ncbi:hypothetical protein Tco_1359838 [Tanacetum coccineum]
MRSIKYAGAFRQGRMCITWMTHNDHIEFLNAIFRELSCLLVSKSGAYNLESKSILELNEVDAHSKRSILLLDNKDRSSPRRQSKRCRATGVPSTTVSRDRFEISLVGVRWKTGNILRKYFTEFSKIGELSFKSLSSSDLSSQISFIVAMCLKDGHPISMYYVFLRERDDVQRSRIPRFFRHLMNNQDQCSVGSASVLPLVLLLLWLLVIIILLSLVLYLTLSKSMDFLIHQVHVAMSMPLAIVSRLLMLLHSRGSLSGSNLPTCFNLVRPSRAKPHLNNAANSSIIS